jgi:sec-independent protein translocase protein TatC
MATALRPTVSHDDRLSLTEHLDELRSRLVISVLVLLGCFAFTFWQNEAVLDLVNAPLEQTQNLDGEKRSQDPLEQSARFQLSLGAFAREQQKLADASRPCRPTASDSRSRSAWPSPSPRR